MSPEEFTAHIQAVVDEAPPLTAVQRARLAGLLAPMRARLQQTQNRRADAERASQNAA